MAYDGTLKFDTAIDSSGFQAGISKISGIASKGIKATAAVIAGAATAVTGFAASAVKAGSDFEAGMSKVQAISGASADDVSKLTDKAKEMGAKTKFSATESAEAFEYMAMAGWKTGDMLNSIEGIMNLAAASGEDLGRTSDIVTDAMTAFGMAADGTTTIVKDGFSKEVSNATHFADVLSQTASSANTNVSMLGESFKYVAPVAGAMGYSVEDAAVALGLMANSGIKASTAGTALRQLITNMAKPTDAMASAMDYLGLSLQNSDGSMKSLKEIMDDLRSSLGQCKMPMTEFQKQMADIQAKYESGELTEKKYSKAVADLTEKAYGAEGALKAKYAATLAGQEGMSGLLAIVNTSAEDYDKLTESIYNADGAAEKMANTMNDNLQGAITLAKSALESVQISLYEKVQEPMKDTVKTVTSMLEDMNDSIAKDGFSGLTVSFASSLAKLAQMGMSEAPKLVELAGIMCNTFIQEVMKHSPEFADAASNLAMVIIITILSFAGTFWSASTTLVAEFLSGIADNLPQITEAGKAMLRKLSESLIDNAPSLSASATKIVITLISELAQGIPEILEVGKEFIQGLIKGIKQESPQLGSLLEGIFDGFTSIIGPELEEVQKLLKKVFDTLKDADPDTLYAIGKAIGKIAAAFVTLKTASAVSGTISVAASALKAFSGGSQGVLGVIPKLTEGFFLLKGGAGSFSEVLALEFPRIAKFATKISELASTATSASKIFGSAGTTIAGIGSIIAGAALSITNFVDMFQNGFNVVKEILMLVGIALVAVGAIVLGAPAVVAGVIAAIVAAVATAVVLVKEHWEQISSFFKAAFESFKTWGNQMLQKSGEIAKKCIDRIVQFFSQLPGKIWTWLTNTYNKLVTWGSNTVQKARDIGSNVVQTIIRFFSELPEKMRTHLSEAVSKVTSWGSELFSAGSNAATYLVNAVINGVSGLPGQMWTIGSNIVTGVWNGICSAGSWFANSVRNFFSNIVNNAKSALGIHSPSRVFADEVGQWIPPGIGEGIEDKMPDLYEQMDTEMSALGKRMQMAVKVETGKIAIDKNANTTYKAVKEKQGVFSSGDTTVEIAGETHVHVELDGKEVARAQTPLVDRNLARIDAHKKRGG